MAIPTEFTYLPVDSDKREIRLFVLDPGNSDDSVSGTFKVVDLHTRPEYEALSYVWGDDRRDAAVSINCQSLVVTRNLQRILRFLRHPSNFRILWIDAICINQSDIAERNRQVQLMRSIYELASRVVSWIDNDNFSKMARLVDRAKACRFDYIEWLIKLGENRHQGEFAKFHEELGALIACFTTDDHGPCYWQRAWITQEVAVAADVLLQYEDVSVSRDDLWRLVEPFGSDEAADAYIRRVPAGMRLEFRDQAVCRTFAVFFLIFKRTICHQLFRANHDSSLFDLLVQNRFKQASDPRDKVYALVSLAKSAHGEIPSAVQIPVDYNKNTRDVYFDAFEYVLRTNRNLSILRFSVPSAANIRGLPTWIPDWSTANTPSWPPDERFHQTQEFTLAIQPEIDGDCRVLSVSGFIFGQISQAFQLLPTHDVFHKLWQSYARESVIDGLFSVTNIISAYHQRLSSPYLTYQDILACILCLDEFDEPFLGHASDILAADIGKHDDTRLTELVILIQQVIGRVFFSTLIEHQLSNELKLRRNVIGVGPPGIRDGDLLCFVLGCESPLILRQKGSRYELVGSGYIPCFIDGKILRDFNRGLYQLDRLEIV